MKKLKHAGLFCIGGGIYVALELLWRGRSHISMFLAGGTCFLLLGQLRKTKLPLPVQALAGAGMITAVELAAGLIANRQYQVWDYRGAPLNVQGQICLPYTLLWCTLSAAVMAALNQKDKHNKPDS